MAQRQNHNSLPCLRGDFTKLVFVLLFPGSKEEVHQAVEHHFLLAQLPRAIHEASHQIQPIQSNQSAETLDNNERIQICFGFTIEHLKECKKNRLESMKLGIGTSQHIPTHLIHSNKHQRNPQKRIKHHIPLTPPPTQKKNSLLPLLFFPAAFFLAGISPCETRRPAIASPVLIQGAPLQWHQGQVLPASRLSPRRHW